MMDIFITKRMNYIHNIIFNNLYSILIKLRHFPKILIVELNLKVKKLHKNVYFVDLYKFYRINLKLAFASNFINPFNS